MKRISALLVILLIIVRVQSQENKPPFWNDIQAFKQQDSVLTPPKDAILFVGSSSFTKWKDVQDYFPGYPIINRGFGGSTLADVIYYANDIIFPYRPSQVVIYCGENDVASSDTITASIVFKRFKTLFRNIRKHLPRVPIVFVSLKPSPSRWERRRTMQDVNTLVKNYLKKNLNTAFVDIWPAMLGKDRRPVDSLFVNDKLHMTERGYVIWQKAIAPYLKKNNNNSGKGI
jgi:lysophospholipase L1-like esterase